VLATKPRVIVSGTSKEAPASGDARASAHRYLVYALPRGAGDTSTYIVDCGKFELHDVPLGSPESFLDFEGVVVFAGSFEAWGEDILDGPQITCLQPADLDLREREFFTALKAGKVVVFLVPHIRDRIVFSPVDPSYDLFRRVAARLGIGWKPLDAPIPYLNASLPEFNDYLGKYGAGYLRFPAYMLPSLDLTVVCEHQNDIYGLVVADRVFFLPCAFPKTHQQAVDSAVSALTSVLAYRKRLANEVPPWVVDFRFQRESCLVEEAGRLHARLEQVKSATVAYQQFKGALCLRSEPLVQAVLKLLREFLGIELEVEDKRIEDATLKDTDGKILAVTEIKGGNRNFGREDINQVDSHRERLGLPAQTPGILIMNTLMTATSLAEKDLPPHPDIIKKAVADNVLMVRTLDLLRYADGVESGTLKKKDLLNTLLHESGWMRVAEGQVETVKE